MLKYHFLTKADGIYYWRQQPNKHLVHKAPPKNNSNLHDLHLNGRPKDHASLIAEWVDSDWAGYPQTQISMAGTCIQLAGGTIAYKTQLLKTVAQLSTEAEFMGACHAGKLILFVRSIPYYGISESHNVLQHYSMKITLRVLQWRMHKSQRHKHDT